MHHRNETSSTLHDAAASCAYMQHYQGHEITLIPQMPPALSSFEYSCTTKLRSALIHHGMLGSKSCCRGAISESVRCYGLLGCSIYPWSIPFTAMPAAQAAPDLSQHARRPALLVSCILVQGLSCFTCAWCDVSSPANKISHPARLTWSCSVTNTHPPLPLQWFSALGHTAPNHSPMPAYCAHDRNQVSLSKHRAAELQLDADLAGQGSPCSSAKALRT